LAPGPDAVEELIAATSEVDPSEANITTPACGSCKHTGDAYTQQILGNRADRLARVAFQGCVSSLVAPGATIFDFGAGTGIDARAYAGSGYRVLAYDHDPQMCDAFRRSCAPQLGSGQIVLMEGDYRQFLATEPVFSGRKADLVTANFAPFNLIEDLPELFRKLQALTLPGGRVLVSALSPFFIGDMRFRWWWRNQSTLRRDGQFTMRGVWTVTRRTPANFAALAAPCFRLAGVRGGLPGSRLHAVDSPMLALPMPILAPLPLPLMAGRYMFLLFERA
jgi:SAM-dependent methyltransferase